MIATIDMLRKSVMLTVIAMLFWQLADGEMPFPLENQIQVSDPISYTVTVRNKEGWSERDYSNVTWVSMQVSHFSLDAANKYMYPKLYQYFQGQNSKRLKMKLPGLVRTSVEQCVNCKPTMTMSMPVPSKVAEDGTPDPVNSKLFIEHEPPTSYIVRTFFGQATEAEFTEEARAMFKAELPVEKASYFAVWYKSPFYLRATRCEVWLVVKQDNEQEPVPKQDDGVSSEEENNNLEKD